MSNPLYKFELFFELSPDLLCIAGYDGYFKKINPAVSLLLGYSMEELYTRPINEFVYHEDRDITAGVRKELTRARPLLNFENRYVTKSGEIVWLSWTSLPIEDDQLIFAIAKNITHKKRLEAERNALLENLTEVNKDLKRLTFTASHDLRSPVNNLISLFNLIDNSRISDQETLELIEVVKQTGEQLKQSLNKYVDGISDQNKVHTSIQEVDLQESLDGVQQSISLLIQASKATIRTDFSGFHKVAFNRSYLESIYLNLITNSIKYARPDAWPVITITTQLVNGNKQLIFADNGRGFDMEKVKDKIFGLHQTFHNYADSRGIGLYLVYNHVVSLGGQVKVESNLDQGTKFIISFKE